MFSLWFLAFPLACWVCSPTKLSMKPRALTRGKAGLLPALNFLLRVIKNKVSLLICFYTQFSHSVLPSSLLLLAFSLLGFSRIFFFLRKVERKKSPSTWQKETKFLQVNLQKGNNSYLRDSSTHAHSRGSEAWSITCSINRDFSFRESHSWLKTAQFKMPFCFHFQIHFWGKWIWFRKRFF